MRPVMNQPMLYSTATTLKCDNITNITSTNIKLYQADTAFKRLNNYHQNINLTTEINPTKILDTKLNCVNDIYKAVVHTERQENCQYTGHLK